MSTVKGCQGVDLPDREGIYGTRLQYFMPACDRSNVLQSHQCISLSQRPWVCHSRSGISRAFPSLSVKCPLGRQLVGKDRRAAQPDARAQKQLPGSLPAPSRGCPSAGRVMKGVFKNKERACPAQISLLLFSHPPSGSKTPDSAWTSDRSGPGKIAGPLQQILAIPRGATRSG